MTSRASIPRISLLALLFMIFTLAGCGGGGGGGGESPPPPANLSQSVSGGGVKGPLVNAGVAFYTFDANYISFQSATAAATGTTNNQAEFVDIALGGPGEAPTPPYIAVFTANADTTDLNTGLPPIISSMRTVVTQEMLDSNRAIYATPLSTMAVDLAIQSALCKCPPYTDSEAYNTATLTKDKFLAALPIAAEQIKSTLGFGMSNDVDLFNTPPIVNDTTTDTASQNLTAGYRGAIEAFAAVINEMEQQVNESVGTVSTDDMVKALVDDLADGTIDGKDGDGDTITNLPAAVRETIENADPEVLLIPGTNTTVANIEGVLKNEQAGTGNGTVNTTNLTNTSTTTAPAQINPDRDADGVQNSADAFPDDSAESKDTDRDGTGNNADTDDDNDGVIDSDDKFPLNAKESADLDNDCPTFVIQTLISGNGCGDNSDTDVDGDGVLNLADAFPRDPLASTLDDADGDGWDNIYDTDSATAFGTAPVDTDADGIPDFDQNGANLDPDDDNDGVIDENDAFPQDKTEVSDSDADGAGDLADTDDDNDGTCDVVDATLNDGICDIADAFPRDVNESIDTDRDGKGNNADTDDDNDGVLDTAETDGCSLKRDCDSDGRMDNFDKFPLNPGEHSDLDGDCGTIATQNTTSGEGCGDKSDTDSDGDGVANGADPFPLDPTRAVMTTVDTDPDLDGYVGEGDNCPTVPNPGQINHDPDGQGDACDTDDDNDEVADTLDNCPIIANTDQVNTDSALESAANVLARGDACDDDDDNDGVRDADEALRGTNRLLADTDGDGVNDLLDPFPTSATDSIDSDKDGISNTVDNCPTIPNPAQLNFDMDTQGDVCDPDDDNDLVADLTDRFPLNADESRDSDNDGKGNNADTDDDNDGVLDTDEASMTTPGGVVSCSLLPDCDRDGMGDALDAFDTNPLETVDSDGDGTGNVADICPFDATTATDVSVCSNLGAMAAALNSGVYFIDAHQESGPAGFTAMVTGSLTWNQATGTRFEERFFDPRTRTWVMRMNNVPSLRLGETGGWALVPDVFEVTNVTGDTADLVHRANNILYSDIRLTLASTNTKALVGIGLTTEVSASVSPAWNQSVDPAVNFSPNTLRYLITGSPVMDEYRVDCDHFQSNTSSDGCGGIAISYGTNGAPILATALADVLVDPTATGAPPSLGIGGSISGGDCYTSVEFEAAATAGDVTGNTHFYANCGQQRTLLESDPPTTTTWTLATVRTVEVLEFTIPAVVMANLPESDRDQSTTRFLTVYGGFVRYGSKESTGAAVQLPAAFFNKVAMDDLMRNFDPLGLFAKPIAASLVLPALTATPAGLGGVSWLEVEGNNGPQGVSYGYGSLVGDLTASTETFFEYKLATDVDPETWVARTSQGGSIWLGPTGWVPNTDDKISITSFNADGSAILTGRGPGNEVLESLRLELRNAALTGRNVRHILRDPRLQAAYLDTLVFPTGAVGYVGNLRYTQDAYEIRCDSDPAKLPPEDSCSGIVTGLDANNAPIFATTLANIVVAATDLNRHNEKYIGRTRDANINVELVGSATTVGATGTANFIAYPYFTNSMPRPLNCPGCTGTWSVIQVNGVVMLVVTVPDPLLPQFEQFPGKFQAFTVYNGYVRRVERHVTGSSESDGEFLVFNPTAINFLVDVANFNPDSDLDGVADATDICLYYPNPGQITTDYNGNGTPDECEGFIGGGSIDIDNDGIPDSSDNCPTVPNRFQEDRDGNGVGDACDSITTGPAANLSMFLVGDLDQDQVNDRLDAYPMDATKQFDSDNDGIDDSADTDDDNDGVLDADDACPLVANATACNPGEIIGAHQLNIQTDSIGYSVTTQPEDGFCFGFPPSSEIKPEFLPMGADPAARPGVVLISGDSFGYYDSTTKLLTARFQHLENRFSSTRNSEVSFPVAGVVNITFNPATLAWTGSIVETLSDGKDRNGGTVPIACSKTSSLATGSMRLYQPTGSEDYNGVYAMELRAFDKGKPRQIAHAGQFVFNAATLQKQVEFHDDGAYRMVMKGTVYDGGSSGKSGGFHYAGLSTHMEDADHDGQPDDLVQDLLVIEGVLVDPSLTTAEMFFRVKGASLVYLNTPSYNLQNASFIQGVFEGEGYAKRVGASGNHIVRTEPGANGLQDVEVINLYNPVMKRSAPDTQLVFAVHPTGDRNPLNTLCSLPFEGNLQYRLDAPRPMMDGLMITSAPYAQVSCKPPVAPSVVVAGSVYDLVVYERSPGTTQNPGVVDTEVASTPYTAVTRGTAPGVIPPRQGIAFNGAVSSQSEVGGLIPVSGFVNPQNGINVTWPAMVDADEYSLMLWDQRDGQRGNEQTRFTIPSNNSVHIGLDANINGPTQVRLMARFGVTGSKSHALSEALLLAPGINGLVNVELRNSVTQQATVMQLDLAMNDFGGVRCGRTDGADVHCDSPGNVVDWMNNRVVLKFHDVLGSISGAPNSPFEMQLQFSVSDGIHATVSVLNTPWTGKAKVVTPELIARTRIRSGGGVVAGLQSTQFVLENPLPTYATGVLSGSGVVLDGAGATSIVWWDEQNMQPFFGKVDSFVEYPVGGSGVQTTRLFFSYDSNDFALGKLADGKYRVELSGAMMSGPSMPIRSFAVQYAGVDASSFEAPARGDVMINGVAGQNFANATSLSNTAINVSWAETGAALDDTTFWRIVAQRALAADIIGQHMDMRSEPLLHNASGPLVHDVAGGWVYTNPGNVDLAGMFASGDTVRVLLFATSADGKVRSTSQPAFVTMP